MKCFYHRDVDAVGSCRSCSKGLCSSCAVDVSDGLACLHRCEERVRALNNLTNRSLRLMPVSEQVYGRYPRAQFLAAAFAISAGCIFTMLGLDMRGTARAGITSMGILALLAGVWQVVTAMAVRRASMERQARPEPPNKEMQRTSPGQH